MDELNMTNEAGLDLGDLDLDNVDLDEYMADSDEIDAMLDLGEFNDEPALNQSPEFLQKFAENFSSEFVLLPPTK